MKTQKYGDRDWVNSVSIQAVYGRDGSLLALASYQEKRTDGRETDAPQTRKLEFDGRCTWIKGEERRNGYVYGVKEGGQYVYELRYDEGPGDRAYMEERDRNYLTRILREGKLKDQEPEVWYLWTIDGSPPDIGAWWMGYVRRPNITEMLAAIKPEGVAELDRRMQAKAKIKPPSPRPAPAPSTTTAPPPPTQRREQQSPPSSSPSSAATPPSSQINPELQEKASAHYAKAKTEAVVGKYEEALQSYQLAHDAYKVLSTQGMDCTKRLEKIKQKRKDVQAKLSPPASTGSSNSSAQKSSSSGTLSASASTSQVPQQEKASTSGGHSQGEKEKSSLPVVAWDESYNVQYKDLQYGKELGRGGFGIVYRGSYNLTDVAIKELLLKDLPEKLLADFKSEAMVMAKLHHPKIVQLIGVCLEPGHYCMVMEYMDRGSLYNLLQSDQDITWDMKIRFADEVATGLSYLHSRNILHRDLKSLNVLLTVHYEAKLSDFGLAKIKSTTSSMSKTQHSAGTLAWMAPELFEGESNTIMADVYSYGIVLWEIATREIPFSNAPNPSIVGVWVGKGKRPETSKIPQDCPVFYSALIAKCWERRREDRPKMEEVLRTLRTNRKDEGTATGTGSPGTKAAASRAPAVVSPPVSGPRYALGSSTSPTEDSGSKTKDTLQSGPRYV